MKKVNLHFHSGSDKKHRLPYSTEKAIDYAVELGYGALAITCHGTFEWTEDVSRYAKEKGLLLIPGIEAMIADETGRRSDVLILNCDKSVESINDFSDLKNYKEAHPEAFIVAPHPYFYGNFSLQDNLEKHIDLFDAIEHSWFYTPFFNRNKRARDVAHKYKKPFISTSDTHWLSGLRSDYIEIEANELEAETVFTAIREGRYANVTKPRTFFGTFVRFVIFTLKDRFLRILYK